MEVKLSCAKEESWICHKYKLKGEMDMEQKSTRVKSDTDSKGLAGYLAYMFESGITKHELDYVDPSAVCVANKAVASARGILALEGIDIDSFPSFF